MTYIYSNEFIFDLNNFYGSSLSGSCSVFRSSSIFVLNTVGTVAQAAESIVDVERKINLVLVFYNKKKSTHTLIKA